MSEQPATFVQPTPPGKKERLFSLDAFRGFTIFGMIFVIAVAAGGYQLTEQGLPQKMSWFGSIPVSTWFHADVAYGLWEADFREDLPSNMAPEEVAALIQEQPQHDLKNIGVTFTDLIAPFFVFIVGAVIPLSRVGKADNWLPIAFQRMMMLIVMGIIYIALVIKQISPWWGVLQAIGVAYFMAVACWRLPSVGRWIAVLTIGAINLILTETVPLWTHVESWTAGGFGSLTNPQGNWMRALTIHCLPWLSISYGVMAMIGVLLGDALASRDQGRIVKQCLLVGSVFAGLGYAIHLAGFATENYSLCFNKPIVTTSYAFFTAGLGAFFYLGFYYILDILKIRAWAVPLTVFGVNPLLAYFWMILMRRLFESLGVIGLFHRYENPWMANKTEEGLNVMIHNWAVFIGGGEPSQAVISFFDKSGYTGMMWGLIWTFLLWLIVLWHNKKGFFWKL